MKLAVFFERDGVLNEPKVEGSRPLPPLSFAEFRVRADAAAPLRRLREAGFVLLAITHQPGLSRGTLSRRELDRMHDLLRRALPLDDILVCPHEATDECGCCAPRAGLLLEAGHARQIDLEHSFVVSDRWQEAQAAHVAGCRSLLLKSPWNGNGHHDAVFDNLGQAVNRILELHTTSNNTPGPRARRR